jgi:hypothetical protein
MRHLQDGRSGALDKNNQTSASALSRDGYCIEVSSLTIQLVAPRKRLRVRTFGPVDSGTTSSRFRGYAY